jgi:hypothetical protein
MFSPSDSQKRSEALQYVSTAGSDANVGLTAAAPLLSIDLAIQRSADQDAEVRVAAGVYTRGNGLPAEGSTALLISGKTNFSLTGGWDAGFTAQSGVSELEGPTDAEQEAAVASDGSHIAYRIVDVEDCMGASISGFTIRRGYMVSEKSSGILFSASTSSLTNCRVESCTTVAPSSSLSYGGGIYVEGAGNTLDVTVSGCSASRGGGISVSGRDHTIGGTVENNSGGYGGGLYLGSDALSGTIQCAVTGNKALYGGGVYIDGNGNTVEGEVNGNSATGVGVIGDIGANVRGGGVYLAGGKNTISGEVHDNVASFSTVAFISLAPRAYGGGVYVEGDYNTVPGDVWGNKTVVTTLSLISIGSGVYGGGLYASGEYLTVSGDVRDNELEILGSLSNSCGAGICLERAHHAVISGAVTGNVTSTIIITHVTSGHGIYVYGATDVRIANAEVKNNKFVGISGEPEQIYLESTSGDPLTDLVIEGCGIAAAPGTGGYAIVEGTGEGTQDVTGHTIKNNVFGGVAYLYLDHNGGYTAADSGGIGVLNTPNDSAHDAAVAEGNTLE